MTPAAQPPPVEPSPTGQAQSPEIRAAETEVEATVEASEPDVPPPSETVPTEPEPIGQYGWNVSLLVALGSDQARTQLDNFVTVKVDRERQVALVEVDYSAIPDGVIADLPTGSAFVAYVDNAQLSLGFDRSLLGWSGDEDPDPDTWYLGRQLGEPGLPDILPSGADAASLFEDLGVDQDSGRVAMSSDQVRRVGIDGQSIFAALARVDLDTSNSLSIELDNDDADRIAQIRIEIEGDHETEPDVMTIDVSYDIDHFDVPASELGQPVPGFIATPTDPVEQALGGGSEVALRLNLYLGRSTDVVLTPENTLIRVGRTDIFAGPADFQQWQLSREGAERLLNTVLTNPVVASAAYNVYYPEGVSLEIGGSPAELNAHPTHPLGDVDYGPDIDALIALLDDPSWLGDDIVSGPDPWIPDTLSLIALPTEPTPDQVSWPLSAGIRELGSPGTGLLQGEVIVCLAGDDVEAVWALLGSGANHRHLNVNDGESWDATFNLNWPGYRLFSDPCGPDYERYLELLEQARD